MRSVQHLRRSCPVFAPAESNGGDTVCIAEDEVRSAETRFNATAHVALRHPSALVPYALSNRRLTIQRRFCAGAKPIAISVQKTMLSKW
jgi:hypothetical protein